MYVRQVWSNELGDVVTGPAPVKVLDKGLPGLELLVQHVLAKFREHVLLARQTRIYQRLGVELSRNTLVDWVGGAYPPDEPRVVGGEAEPAGWKDEQNNKTKLDRGRSAAGARARGARGAEHGGAGA
jgi:hypothetical protein